LEGDINKIREVHNVLYIYLYIYTETEDTGPIKARCSNR
jgi:hypothetical protein